MSGATPKGTDKKICLERPEDMGDGRWEAVTIGASKLVTGHMPWCVDHVEDDGIIFCQTISEGSADTVTLNNGTLDARPRICR